jgi:hypothetical protein
VPTGIFPSTASSFEIEGETPGVCQHMTRLWTVRVTMKSETKLIMRNRGSLGTSDAKDFRDFTLPRQQWKLRLQHFSVD